MLTHGNPRGNATRYEYDEYNRVTRVTSPLNESVTSYTPWNGHRLALNDDLDVAFLLDNDGRGIEKYTYDAFGRSKIMIREGDVRTFSHFDNLLLFKGREYISEAAVYDFRNRFYYLLWGAFSRPTQRVLTPGHEPIPLLRRQSGGSS